MAHLQYPKYKCNGGSKIDLGRVLEYTDTKSLPGYPVVILIKQ